LESGGALCQQLPDLIAVLAVSTDIISTNT
jgi:hypothetical protein